MPKPTMTLVLASMLLTRVATTPAPAAEAVMKARLKPFNVTIRVFDPAKGVDSGTEYVLPVDSPDAEHAAASTMSNAVSFTTKTDGGTALPVAFICVKVEPR